MDKSIGGNIRLNHEINAEDKRRILQTLKNRYPSFILNEAALVNLTQEAEKRVYSLFQQGWVLINKSPNKHTPIYVLLPPEHDKRREWDMYMVSVPLKDILVNVPHYALLKNAGEYGTTTIPESSVRSSCVIS